MAYAKSEETKQQLVQTMSRLIRTQGYHATGISQVLKESGIPKGSLYYHFPDGKTELAAAAVHLSNEWIIARLRKMVDVTDDPMKTLNMFCNYYIEQMQAGNFLKGCPIATITLEAAATVDPIQLECKYAFDAMIQLLTAQLEAHGVLAQKAADLATVAIAMIEGALILSRAQRDTRPLIVIRDNLSQQLQDAIASGGT